MTISEYSVNARKLLRSTLFLIVLSFILVLSKGSCLAFDPTDPDPLSLGGGSGGQLEPDEITPPVLTLKVLDGNDTAEDLGAAPSPAPDPETQSSEPPPADPPEITRGHSESMNVSITFDGGGYEGGEEAEAILSILRAKGIKATIFLTGMFIRKYPDLVREMVADGHEVGNHTLNHPHLTDFDATFRHNTLSGVDKEFVLMELNGTAELFRKTTGVEMAPLWRAPYGEINREIRQWAYEAGYIHVGWTYDARSRESLDTLDWVYDRNSRLYRTPNEIMARVLNFGKGSGGIKGGIILMHLGTLRKDDRASTVLGEMLDGLKGKGLKFVKVSEQLEGTEVLKAVRKQRGGVKGIVKLSGPEDTSKPAADLR